MYSIAIGTTTDSITNTSNHCCTCISMNMDNAASTTISLLSHPLPRLKEDSIAANANDLQTIKIEMMTVP
jgi:hypothetical protein